jgi:hypothetical protein
MQRSSLAIPLAAALALVACAPEAKIRYAERSSDAPIVVVGTPTLVAIAPDVWVLEDADHAVYYTRDRYWVLDRGQWFESFSFEAGWTPVDGTAAVPETVVNRNHGYYTQYHGEASAERRRPPTRASSIQARAASSAPTP